MVVEDRFVKISEFAQIKIVPTKDGKELSYEVIEPELTEKEKPVLKDVKKLLRETIEYDYEALSKKENPEEYLKKKLKEVIKEKFKKIGKKLEEKIEYYIIRDFIGFGKIDAIMKDPNIEDVYCNGVKIPVFVRHRKHGSLKTNIIFRELDELEKFVMILSQKSKRFVTYAEPLLDATLPDGSRIQATFGQDVTLKGPTFSIRKFQKLPLTPVQLIKFGTTSPAMMAYFWLAIEHNISLLISGGSGTGKTTLLNAICMFIPPDYKIISIEDTSEMNLPHENWVKSITRSGYGPKKGGETRYGEVSMFDLLKMSLRQRPDYVIVGEVRGKEASVLFQGMASGHASLGTIHAESLDAVIERLTTPPINLPPSLIELIDIVVIEVLATSKGPNARRISKVIEIKNVSRGKPDVRTPFMWDSYNDNFMPIESFLSSSGEYDSFLIEKLSLQTGRPKEELLEELKKREKVINWMIKNDVESFHDVFDIISSYWYSPKTVLERISKEKRIKKPKKEKPKEAKPKKLELKKKPKLKKPKTKKSEKKGK
jgi:flagellar protein FlaI